jgi:hypothetical protein
VTLLTHTGRQRIRAARNEAKRQEIADAHGRTLNPCVSKLAECEHCGAIIPATRRFCDQECVNAHRRAKKAGAA